MFLFNFLKKEKSSTKSLNDNFINDLSIFEKKVNLLKNLPNNTKFIVDRIESNFAVSENQTTGKMFDIPLSILNFSVKEGSNFILEDNNNLTFKLIS